MYRHNNAFNSDAGKAGLVLWRRRLIGALAVYRSPLTLCLFAILPIISFGCAVQTHEQSRNEPEEAWIYPAEAMARQSECVTAWEILLDDWESSGGGVLDSLTQIRAQIQSDQNSKFSALVREVWASQENITDFSLLGAWPVSSERYRRVTVAISEVAGDFVPDYCQVPIYLTNWWYKRIIDRRLIDMPHTVEDDPWPKSNWLQYWIFSRVE